MKTRNAFATLTICVLSALTIAEQVNLHKVLAQCIADCRKFVTGTYLTTNSGDFC
jgi:pimeloyl-CoA synthetase